MQLQLESKSHFTIFTTRVHHFIQGEETGEVMKIAKRLSLFCLLLGLVCISRIEDARAELAVCNDTGTPVKVAFGFLNAANSNTYGSRGWFYVQPGVCGLAFNTWFPDTFYFYAESKDGDIVWSGKDTRTRFCTAGEHGYFNIVFNARDPSCPGYNFMEHTDKNKVKELRLVEDRKAPKEAALECKSELSNGMNKFADCFNYEFASNKQKQILECRDQYDNTASFVLCASNSSVPDELSRSVGCVDDFSKTRESEKFLNCVNGGFYDQSAAAMLDCAIKNKSPTLKAIDCLPSSVTSNARRLYDCFQTHPDSTTAKAICIGGKDLTSDQKKLLSCATGRASRKSSFEDCVAQTYMPEDQARILNCAKTKEGLTAIGTCAASSFLGDKEAAALQCIVDNPDSYLDMATCAAGSDLTPEQKIFVECAISSGGNPYAFAGCAGTRLTTHELQKCFSQGIGGDGCFGDSHDVVKALNTAWRDVTEGPGPSNDITGRNGWLAKQLGNAQRDLRYGPGETNDLVGRKGWLRGRLGF